MAVSDYEELKFCSIANITGASRATAVLTADYGGGWQEGAVVLPFVLRRWNLSAAIVPDKADYAVNYFIGEIDYTDTRFRYFWDFYRRHLMKGNLPFVITEPDSGKKYLAAFEETRLSLERFAYKLYGGLGLTVKEARRRDVAVNADGSIAGTKSSAKVLTFGGKPLEFDGKLVEF